MKILKIIFILSCLFAFINSTCEIIEENSKNFNNYKDCINRQFSSNEIEDEAYKCCYVEIEFKVENNKIEAHGCTPLSQSQYNNIDQVERTFQADLYIEDIDIDCESSFIKLEILFLLYFLLFI